MKLFGYSTEMKAVELAPEKSVKKKSWKKLVLIISASVIVLIITVAVLLHILYVKPPEIYVPPEIYDPQSVTSNENNGTPSPAVDDKGEAVHIERNGERKEDYYTFVLCGTDEGEYRTDTIMVASYDVANQKINIVSVPRDTMLNVTWTVKRVNTAYAIDGIERLKEALSGVLGFHVDFYATVDLEAFVEIIDAIGGVEFDVPQDMNYSDPTQDLYINLKAGLQPLDGEKAMELIRFRRYVQGDIQRVSVQQDFMKAVAGQILQVGNITKVNQIAEILSKYMDTDLTLGNIIWLGEQMLSLNTEDICTSTLPGVCGTYEEQSYWLLDAAGVLDIINEYINPYTEDISLNDLDIVTLSNGSIVSSTGKEVLDPTVDPDVSAEDPAEPVVFPTPVPEASPEATVTPEPTSAPENTAEPTTDVDPDTTTPTGNTDEDTADAGN